MKNWWTKIDAWLKKYQDKLLHFAVFGWAVQIGLSFGLVPGIIVFVIMAGLAVLKEYVLDKEVDKWDLWFGLAGGVLAFLVKLINVLVG